MKTCSSCGASNEDAAVFCVSCHHFLDWADPSKKARPRRPTPERESTHADPAGVRPPGPPATTPVNVADLIAAIDEGLSLANGHQRPDLTAQLNRVQVRLESRTVTAVVVGEFKRGKSTLINALIQTAVCPVDADIVTAVPTLVRYGDQVGVTSYEQTDDDAQPVPHERSLDSITSLVSERQESSGSDVRSVEVRVPHRILRSGLCMLDTPGVGGLESVHGQVTLGALTSADCVIFVTDAAQELTGPEMEFLRTAVDRCPSAALVVTKTDIYPQWRGITGLDQAHLMQAGLNIPVIPVSSFLRLRAAHQPALNQESGFATLVQFLASRVVAPSTAKAVAAAAHDVDFVAAQLAKVSEAERVVLAKPEERAAVVTQLNRAGKKALGLTAASATWQQTLADGIQDLVADVEHDLQRRLRTILRDAESVIDEGDPKDMWQDTDAWLRRQVAAAALANHDMLISRARELSDDVAEQFDLEAGTGVEVELNDVTHALEALELGAAADAKMPGGRLGPMVVAARLSFLVPVMVFQIGAGVMTGGATLPLVGVSATLGAGIGAKLFKSESQRQRAYRQQSAKAAARKFVDEVAFIMNKETRDGLRRAQRVLRDDLQARASAMHRSTAAAIQAAQRATTLAPEEQAARSGQLAAESGRLRSIRSNMKEYAAVGARSTVAAGLGVGVGVGVHYVGHEIADTVSEGPHTADGGDHDG